ncbi:MAG: winged helix-turn-helix domain-containing protein [Terriglobales bacterium]
MAANSRYSVWGSKVATALKQGWVRFGSFEANLESGDLYRDGHRVALQQKPFELLRILVEHPGEVLSREELRQRLWASDIFVDFEAGLNAAIKRLRRALDDEADNPRFIATLPRRGYRFIAPIELPPPLPRAAEPRRRLVMAASAGLAALLCGLGYLLRPALPPPVLADAVAITPPSALPANQVLVTDGPSIFFAQVATGGSRQLMRVPAEGGVPLPLELPFPAGSADILDVTPDGAELLLRERVADRLPLWEIPTQGGTPQRLGALEAPDAAWLPSGAGLAYTRGHALYSADAGGAHAQRLLEVPGEPYYPRWSPDQRHLRFTSFDRRTNRSQLWDFDTRTGRLWPPLGGPDGLTQPWGGEWSRDGRYFVYLPETQPGAIWARRERASLWRRASSAPVRLTSGPLSFSRAIFSRDGRHLFAIGTLDRGELVRYDRHKRQLESYLDGRSADALDFSRDGRWLAYVAYPERTLWRMDRHSGGLEQLTRGPAHALMPYWSPNGSHLAYTREAAGAPWRVIVMSADGSRAEAVTSADLDAGEAVWSPGGDRLAFMYRHWGTTEPWRLSILRSAHPEAERPSRH